ncbi:MAG: hypothetical protein LUG46_02730 [Erysipelotrichaceae bacterium]|nr:hypothetical protein [Erysipelotrichaceae bacterium]
MIYFTSDLHLGHQSVINMCQRPFDNIDEMNKTIIHNWNDTVTNNDTVYILGDLSYRIKNDEANSLIKKLKGKKILIIGNHDNKYGMYDESLFEEICYYKELKYNHIKFILFHYPIEDWNGMYSGSVHLHGHSHNKSEYNLLMKEKGLRRYDVGVDANEFKPISLEDIINFVVDD